MARGRWQNDRCGDCKAALPPPHRGGLCAACKALRARLAAMHGRAVRRDAGEACDPDRPERERRVVVYAAVVECGGRLFEGA